MGFQSHHYSVSQLEAGECMEDSLPRDARTIFCFGSSRINLSSLVERISSHCPQGQVLASTTCGEIGPAGLAEGGASVAVLPADIRSGTAVVPKLSKFRFEQGEEVFAEACHALGTTPGEVTANPQGFGLITLCDGLSGREELLVAAMGIYAPGVPLVGGSAGDDFQFKQTAVAHGRKVFEGGATVTLLRTKRPMRAFYAHHYRTTNDSYVVTAADPDRRMVYELDGQPATLTASALLQVPRSELLTEGESRNRTTPLVFGFQAAGGTHLRSVMQLYESGLLMGGAVEVGAILTIMTAEDLVAHTRQQLSQLQAEMGEIAGGLVFSCGGRLWEARRDAALDALSEAMGQFPLAGFTTYGEQYGPLQVNHSLTGLVFGVGHDQ